MNRLISENKRKLQSQRGASIVFALLLFLACAAIGSAVIAVGTATAGRKAQLAEMDQRYYSVMSAVNLLQEELDGQGVRIDRSETIGTRTTYTVVTDAEGNESTEESVTPIDPEYETSMTFLKNNTELKTVSPAALEVSLLGDYAYNLVFGSLSEENLDTSLAFTRDFGNDGISNRFFKMSHGAVSGVDTNALEANVVVEYQGDGYLNLTVDSDGYAVIMHFSRKIDFNTSVSSYEETDANAVINTDTTTKTTTITWTLSDILVDK